jgi:hypothetical protein
VTAQREELPFVEHALIVVAGFTLAYLAWNTSWDVTTALGSSAPLGAAVRAGALGNVAHAVRDGAVYGMTLALVALAAKRLHVVTLLLLTFALAYLGFVGAHLWWSLSGAVGALGILNGKNAPLTPGMFRDGMRWAWESLDSCVAWAIGFTLAAKARGRRFEGFLLFAPDAIWNTITAGQWAAERGEHEFVKVVSAGVFVLVLQRLVPLGLMSLGIHTRPEVEPSPESEPISPLK